MNGNGGWLVLVGRILLCSIFLMSGANKIFRWSSTAAYMKSEGMFAVPFFLLMAILFEVAGGLMVLLGFRGKLGAWLLIVFLIPTTLIFHDFWTLEGQEAQMQRIQFMKNLAILGGLCVVAAHGSGRYSLDARSTGPRRDEAPSR